MVYPYKSKENPKVYLGQKGKDVHALRKILHSQILAIADPLNFIGQDFISKHEDSIKATGRASLVDDKFKVNKT